jgi:hypothetical protein
VQSSCGRPTTWTTGSVSIPHFFHLIYGHVQVKLWKANYLDNWKCVSTLRCDGQEPMKARYFIMYSSYKLAKLISFLDKMFWTGYTFYTFHNLQA